MTHVDAPTPDMVVQCCRETGIHLHRGLGAPTHADVIGYRHFCDGHRRLVTTIPKEGCALCA